MPLYSCTFLYKEYASLSPCCTFCRLTTHATSSSLFLFFSTSMFGHSHLQCPIPQHLKHLTSSTISFLPIFTSSLTLHLITLLNNTSNLFLGISFPFFSFFLFLQLQARCLNFLQLQHSLSLLLSNCTLSEARAHFSLSMLLRRLLYWSRDMVLCLQRDQNKE